MQASAPYGTVCLDSWSSMDRTPIKHISGCECSHLERNSPPPKPKNKRHGVRFKTSLRSCSLVANARLLRINYQLMPTTWCSEVMQMQLALICIQRQQLTDAQMADNGDALAIFWQRERLAAILSEAVPIWMETTTLHYCDDDSSLGDVGAHCCCCSQLKHSRPNIYSPFTHTHTALWCR